MNCHKRMAINWLPQDKSTICWLSQMSANIRLKDCIEVRRWVYRLMAGRSRGSTTVSLYWEGTTRTSHTDSDINIMCTHVWYHNHTCTMTNPTSYFSSSMAASVFLQTRSIIVWAPSISSVLLFIKVVFHAMWSSRLSSSPTSTCKPDH